MESIILGAALEVFLEQGYEGATMEAIAERARISKGTLYARFSTKEPLFRAVLERKLAQWSAIAGAEDHSLPRDLAKRLRHHARTLHRMFELPEYVQVVQLVESSTAAFPDIRQFWQQAGRAGFVAFLAADMARTVDLPPQINPDWEFLANLFLNGIAGWYLSESIVREIDETEFLGFADQLIGVIVQTVPNADYIARG